MSLLPRHAVSLAVLGALLGMASALADQPAPIVSITSPADNACTNQASLAVVVACSDPGPVAEVHADIG